MKLSLTPFSLIIPLICLAAPAEAKRPAPLTADEIIKAMTGSWDGSGVQEKWTVTATGDMLTLVSTGVAAYFDANHRQTSAFRYRQTLKVRIERDPSLDYAQQEHLRFIETDFQVVDVTQGAKTAAELKASWKPMGCTMRLVADRERTYTPVLNGACDVYTDGRHHAVEWRVDWRGRKNS